ncbi:Cyclin [Paragonimus heterotremus]|uniref:Protein CNPPD1 n=1 Tax=Paragonimus heterotremus TaxID=100268 RepID=A0A8J4TJP2_9TREM|nr:Cyclin [Paragonimus heterotremus]
MGFTFNSLRDIHGNIRTDVPDFTDHVADFVNSVVKRRLGKLDPFTVTECANSKFVPPVSMLTALIFIKKFASSDPPPQLADEITAVDLFVIALTTASKYLHDVGTEDGLDNAGWAELFNMDVKDLNKLEIKFLCALNWKCFVEKIDYNDLQAAFNSVARCKRPWVASVFSRSRLWRSLRGISRSRYRSRASFRILALLSAAYLTACVNQSHHLLEPSRSFSTLDAFEETSNSQPFSVFRDEVTFATNRSDSCGNLTFQNCLDFDWNCFLLRRTEVLSTVLPERISHFPTTNYPQSILVSCGG